MRPLSDADWVRLVRYFAGELTPAENQELERWDEDQPGWNRTLGVLRQAWRARPAKQFAGDSQALWITLQQAIGTDGGAVAPRQQSARSAVKGIRVLGTQPLLRRRWYIVATGLLVIGMLGLGWQMRGAKIFRRSMPSTASYTTYATANGEHATIALPDGSTAVLNVASRLEVPTNYTAGNHTVRLAGEALFTVQQHSELPFTVVTGSVQTRVLGTSFAVRRYPSDTTTMVAVQEGRVSVGHTVVNAAQRLTLGTDGRGRIGPADASVFGFAAGILKIDRVPFKTAIPELDRWYAADIRLADSSLGQIPIKGTFAAGSLSDLSNMLEWLLDARVVRDGRVVTLYPKGTK